MRLLFNFVIVLFSASLSAQIGVFTTNPQADVHVAGSNNNIRVDGLNSINNTNNLGGSDLYNLSVDSNGTLNVKPQSGLLSSDLNLITSGITVQSTINSDFNTASLYKKNFTLTSRAMVIVSYTVSVEFKNYSGTGNINDGRTKVAQNYFYLGDGTTANTTSKYGISSCSYSNFTCDTATGYVYNSHCVIVTLEAGTHSIHMNGAVFGGGTSTDASFSGIFGSIDRLELQVIYL